MEFTKILAKFVTQNSYDKAYESFVKRPPGKAVRSLPSTIKCNHVRAQTGMGAIVF